MNEALTFIGKGSGFADKNNSAYYEEDNILNIIDCGFSVFTEIKNKFNYERYTEINIIITHLHNDHAGSLSQLILFLWFTKNIKVNVISKCENIEKYLDITGTPREGYTLKSKIDKLRFIKTQHVQNLDTYGFIVSIKDKKIIYTSDTCVIEPYLEYMNGIDELYIDISKSGGAHLECDKILSKLEEIKSKGIEIYPMHMDDEEYVLNKCKGNRLKMI